MGFEKTCKFAQKFLLCYFALTIFPFPAGLLSPGQVLTESYYSLWYRFFSWFSLHYLHAAIDTNLKSGSGDKAADFFVAFALIPLALILAAFWRNFDRFKPWVETYVRWFLAAMLLEYGFAKVMHGQFVPATLARLVEPVGELSPMGLLWTMMGHSPIYAGFGGIMEITAGLLLLAPRLTTIGAALSCAVMGNVFMMNMCYDVPVKLFSFQLLVFSSYFVALDRDRLLKVFVWGESVPALPRPTVSKKVAWIQIALAVFLLGSTVWEMREMAAPVMLQMQDGPFQGVWRPQDSDWKRVIFDHKDGMALQADNGHLTHFKVKPGTGVGAFEVQIKDKSKPASKLHIERLENDLLKLKGEIDGQAIDWTAKREADLEFPLMTRGFHWINEDPYNR